MLHIVSSMDRGGAETLLMNIYRNIDRTKIQFDFVTHNSKIGEFEEEIKKMGGNIYKIESLGSSGPFTYVKKLKEIMSLQSYEAVHAHTDYQNGFPAIAAKLSGIPERICHSHSNNWLKGNSLKERMIFFMLRLLIQFSATKFCSCSIEASNFLFGEKMFQKKKVQIIKNGVDVRSFCEVNENERDDALKEFGFQMDSKIIGHIGRFSESKNQIYILKILKKMREKDTRFKAVLVGNGPLKELIENEAFEMGLSDHIKFLGVREDIPRLLKAMDVFVFPSLFEGFGLVAIEAQSSGLPCVISSEVPTTTDMKLGLVSYVKLDEDVSVWCKEIKKMMFKTKPEPNQIFKQISDRGYNIADHISEWIKLYNINTI